jgi:hypothetical protein
MVCEAMTAGTVGGVAVTTRYVADVVALKAAEVTGINFALQPSSELLEQVAGALVASPIAAPPITRIPLAGAPNVLTAADSQPADGETVITL